MTKRFWILLFHTLLLLSTLLAAACFGQQFEVASVKLSTSGYNGVRGGCRGVDTKYSPADLDAAPPLGQCVITDGRLSHLIGIAYGVEMGQIKNAPDWVMVDQERYNVMAAADDRASVKQADLLTMLQNLLVSRFELKFHREPTEKQGFGLTVAKGGPKFQVSKAEKCSINMNGGKKGVVGLNVLTIQGCPIAQVIRVLPGLIVDETGLAGVYDFKLEWDETQGPSLVTAVREQLGLRLDSKMVPYSYFVIDSAQRPSAN